LDACRLDGLCPLCAWSGVTEPNVEEAEAIPAPSEASLLAIPGHEVIEEIARGGMGIVYRARQLGPDRIVALKMLLPHQTASAEMRARFRLESQAIASLEHAAILPVYQVGEHHGLPYFTMKFAAGGTLATRREQYHGQYRRIAELMIRLAEGVQFAHEHGVLHRDLKLGNILFDEAGRPYVSDFGLAKFADADDALTRSIHLLGTPQYLAPEVVAGCARSATTASDIYSLGVMLYHLLAGRPPFEADGVAALLRRIAEEEPPRPSAVTTSASRLAAGAVHKAESGGSHRKVRQAPESGRMPRDLEVICLKCLSKNPASRYSSAGALAEDLRRWLDGKPVLARPAIWAERTRRWMWRNPVAALLAVLLGVALAGGGVALVRSNLKLKHALAGMRAALQDTLLAQARLERTSGHTGQRFTAVALIDRAASLLPVSSDPDRDQAAIAQSTNGRSPAQGDEARRLALRGEVAGALALPDLRPLARWSVPSGPWLGPVDFAADLERYAALASDGGINVHRTADHRVVRHYPTPTNNPPVRLKFSGDGLWLAATLQDGAVAVHALESEEPARMFRGHGDFRTAVDFVPGTSQVLVAGLQSGLVLHDLRSGARRDLVAPPETIRSIAAAPDGKRVACFARRAVQVLRLSDSQLLWSWPLPAGTARVAWSFDGRQLAVAESGQPFETTVFDLESGRVVAHFQDHELSVTRLSFHPDGHSLVSVGRDNCLVWRQLSPNGLRLKGQAGWRVLRFGADGQRVAYEPAEGEAGLLEVVPSTLFREWERSTPAGENACMVAASPDGRLLATSSVGGVQIWDATHRAQIGEVRLPAQISDNRLCLHPDGEALIYGGVGAGIYRLELRRAGRPGSMEVVLGPSQPLSTNADCALQHFASDNRSLVVIAAHPGGTGQQAWLWPDANSSLARPLTDGFPLSRYQLTRDGSWGVSSHLTEPGVWIWGASTGARLRNLGIRQNVESRLSPDGRWILASANLQHELWEIGTWKAGPRWSQDHERDNRAICFSADSRWLASAGLEGRVELRRMPKAELVVELPPPHPMRLHDLAFSPDASRLYLWQGTGRLFEWNLAELRRELRRRGLDWEG